ncbi:hypothetical protein AcV7_002462 [Taiwanofungus camphoratus]|nr:hypothetical protein AcV7_002462 [Antrodia cinnamomea]
MDLSRLTMPRFATSFIGNLGAPLGHDMWISSTIAYTEGSSEIVKLLLSNNLMVGLLPEDVDEFERLERQMDEIVLQGSGIDPKMPSEEILGRGSPFMQHDLEIAIEPI